MIFFYLIKVLVFANTFLSETVERTVLLHRLTLDGHETPGDDRKRLYKAENLFLISQVLHGEQAALMIPVPPMKRMRMVESFGKGRSGRSISQRQAGAPTGDGLTRP